MVKFLFKLLRRKEKPVSSKLDSLRPLHNQKCLSDKRYAGLLFGSQEPNFIGQADLAKADVLICAGDGSDLTWKIISYGSSGGYVHAAVYVGNGYVVEATKDGVQKIELVKLINRYPYVAVVRCPGAHPDALPDLAEKVVDFCLRHAEAKTPYNLAGALMAPIKELKQLRYENITHLAYVPPPPKVSTPSLFCSELVIKAFIHGGFIKEGEMDAASLSPTALAEDTTFINIGYLGNRDMADRIYEQDHFMTGGIPRSAR
ncbi:C40 family peptidase [Pseudomonas veronii]|uniref:hypothetical protein n=1 Tax=Pseudomonas veronii TaxID=76761 RepID=UPI0021BE18FD|nr:hypothetical protein [Pseudomonas veronii]MCT9827412.1 hypothetical protein [Pseudomonas veronii]